MIKIQKRQLYKNRLILVKKILPLKLIFHIFSISFLYIILPRYLIGNLTRHSFGILFLFYLTNISTVLYLFKRNSNLRYELEYKIQVLQEDLNLLKEENTQEQKKNLALKAKINRYNSLEKILEELNAHLDLDSVTHSLTSAAFHLISNGRGRCLFYLVDNQLHKLNLYKTEKEDHRLVIKEKEGDIFDLWVLKHTSTLLIEDIKKDFRFDLNKLNTPQEREILSLISSPLLSENSFLGILRLEHTEAGFYTQDDLRFLQTICDLGAVALENSQLYQKTQDLAIHDGLTSLFTKGHFLMLLEEEFKRSIRHNLSLSLLMLDIDYFKIYNDKFGHTAGDIVLKKLSQIIVSTLKDLRPVAGRFGGEEFSVMLPRLDKKTAFTAACKLRERIEREKIILRRNETNVTASIGIASFPEDASDGDDLMRKADYAMYEAKQKGRNRVCCS